MNATARRMFELVEPIGVIPYSTDEPNEAMFALGFTNYWDTYFAGRAAPLGLPTAEVVNALFYNFAPGEVARHIPKVWRTTTPEVAIAARRTGCVKALRRILGDHVDAPAFARAAELLLKAAMCPSPRCSRSKDAEEPGHNFAGDGDGAERRVHGPTLVRCAGRRHEQQFGSACEGGSVDVIAEDPSQRLHTARCRAAIAASGVVVRHTLGMWRATSPGAKL